MRHAEKKSTASLRRVAECETSQLLELCADQIRTAIDEALHEVDGLSVSVLDTARHASALLSAGGEQSPGGNNANDFASADIQALQQSVQDTYMQLQFADRLHQRLSNVAKNLAGLAKLMQQIGLPITDIEWLAFLNEARGNFTMKQERQMFDAVFGAPAAAIGTDPATDASQRMIIFDADAYDDR